MPERPDITKFLNDPAFSADKELMFGVIDARLQHHAQEAEKRKKENEPASIFDVLFGGSPKG